MIAAGVDVLQTALAQDRLGEYQAQAAIAALHCDAASADETDWPQILEWYDELLELTHSPVVALNRAVAVGEADGPLLGLKALEDVPADVPRRTAVAAWLHERAGEPATAATPLRRGRRSGQQPGRAQPPHPAGGPAAAGRRAVVHM